MVYNNIQTQSIEQHILYYNNLQVVNNLTLSIRFRFFIYISKIKLI